MSKTMNKTLQTVEVLNIVAFLEDIARTGKIDELSIKARWAIKKSSKELIEIDTKFKEFKEELESGLKNDYFMNDAKSESTKIIQKDENGQDVEVDGRKVKSEYMDEYNQALEDINNKLREVLFDDNDVTINVFDIDSEIDRLGDDTKFTFEDLEMLSIFDKEDA